MQPPKVQSVEQIVSDLNPAYQGSIDVINNRRSQIPTQFNAQRQALDAAKVQGFNQINTQANAKGLAFSGIPADEQATYLSTKYLPGLTALSQQENEANLSLDEALARINQEQRLKAMDINQNQQSSLEKYLYNQQQMQWEKEKFAAEQALERSKIAASQSSQATPTAAQYIANWAQQISANTPNYQSNYSWENSGIKAALQANYGISGEDSYKLRKQLLGY